jgi:uncharacterized membrane protein
MKFLPVYLMALVLFLAIDAVWLGVIARNFYASRMGSLTLEQPRWGVAALFYLLFVVGLTYFAISAHVASGRTGAPRRSMAHCSASFAI